MQVYDELLCWAHERGIELHGVEPRSIPGRGVGIIATKPLKANERILHVPTSALRTIDTVRPKIKRSLASGTKVHCILAADLALERATSKYAAWNSMGPSREDISASLPLAWDDARLHAFLPRRALSLLRRQESNFSRDWAAVQKAFGSATLTRDDFLYTWLLVNTRTFYHHDSTSVRMARLPRDDHMVLQPVADLFNHADAGCEAVFGPASFDVTADRAYDPGEELHICYGKHPNDFLLAEYGFVLAENKWDELCLDDAILPELSAEQKEQLDESGFLGNYVLDATTVCYRTQVALRLLCVPVEEWRRLVHEGDDGGEVLQQKVDQLLVTILHNYHSTVETILQKLGSTEIGQPCQRDMLRLRWRQIRELIHETIQRLKS